MKKLLFLCLFFAINMAIAQQRNTQGKPIPAGVKSVEALNATSKTEFIPTEKLGRFSMGAGYGITYFLGDIPMDGLYASYGGYVKYSFSHTLGIRVQGMHGKITGSPITFRDKLADAWFTNVTTSFTAQVLLNLGGINFRKSNPKDNIYTGIGGGILLNRARRDFPNALGYRDKREVAEFTIPFVIGYKRKLSNKFDLGFEASYYLTTDDKIDMYAVGKLPDGYGYSAVTLNYNLLSKNRKQHIDWFNPVNKIYKRIDDAKKETIDMAKQDDDGDGIPNFMDEEPNTKKGYKVDNKGVTLDSDGDGIPDTDDTDPYGISQAISKYFPEFGASRKSDTLIYQFSDSVPRTEFVTISATGAGLPLITFPPNGFTVHVEQYPLLQTIARIMVIDTLASLVVIGHADNNRNDITQLTLAEKRALEVKRKLAKIYELEENRILVFSAHDPYVKKYNLGTEGLNRRVEFRIIRPKQAK
jgi:outer membrane protein OmpA-like peptidoglycan-associated protein